MVGLDKLSRSDDLCNPQEEGHLSNPEVEEHLSKPEAEEHLRNPEEEEQRTRELQRSLEPSIPKPRPKPLRSECEIEFSVADSSCSEYEERRYEEFEGADYKASSGPPHPPQYQKYQELLSKQAHPQESTTFGHATEEYTASDYYDSMRAVDKEHHHTTGTGFIKISEPDEEREGFHYLSQPWEVPNAPKSGVSNPAMNDWVPQSAIKVPLSSKPSRSESNVNFWN